MSIEAHIVTPDASKAADWHKRAFDASEQSRVLLPNGRAMAVALHLCGDTFHVSSEFADWSILSPLSVDGTATILQLNSPDASALWQRALAAGAEVRPPVARQLWGRTAWSTDRSIRHRWNIAQKVPDVSASEIEAAAAPIYSYPFS